MAKKYTLPKLEDIQAGINELLLVDNWDTYKIKSSPKKFEKRFNKLFTEKLGLIPYIILVSNSTLLPFKFYRLRKETKTFNESLISEYSYPPNNIIKSVQRANIPYHPVFYCSDNPITAVYETIRTTENINLDTSYYLSEWELRDNSDVKVCPFLFENVAESNPYKILSDACIIKIKELLVDHTEDEISGFINVLKFLSHLFTFDNSYIVSSYIAHTNLYAEHNFRPDIFIYPSSQTERKTVNFAIHPNCVAENLVLKRVFKHRVTGINKEIGSATVKFSHIGKNKNGIIYWSQLTDKTNEGKLVLKEINELFSSEGKAI